MEPTTAEPPNYDAASIKVLPGIEAVRRNPAMYIGSVGPQGLHHLLFELVENAIDEAAAGHCHNITVALHADGSASVEDDGRGIPVDPHPLNGRPACEVVLTTLHAGGKFDGGFYGAPAGLHGVGLSCVNALAACLWLDVWRDGGHFRQEFARGEPAGDLVRLGASDRQGSRVRFRPDETVMECVRFDADTIVERLEEEAFLHPGLRIDIVDERTGYRRTFSSHAGVRGLLAQRTKDATPVYPEPFLVSHRDAGFRLDAAFWWTDGYTEQVRSFANGVRTEHGGTHVDGVRAALAAALNDHAAARGALDPGSEFTTVDVLDGLVAVVAVRLDTPAYDGQTKRRLANSWITSSVETAVAGAFAAQLDADQERARQVLGRVRDAVRSRLAARLAGRTARVRRRERPVDYRAYQRQFSVRSRNWHDSCTWITDDGLLARHAALCDVAPNARMLDVCCGSGVVGAAFRGRVGEMIGLDITPAMVRLGSTRLDTVYQGTVYDLPFADATFDLVVNREVLHLLAGPEQPIAEIFRVLRPGGQFIVGQTMPYADEDAFWMFRIFKKKQPLLFQMFREEEFRELLLDAGFVDLKMDEYLLWESIDRWIDSYETTPAHRREIRQLFYDAPREVRAVHPFEVAADGSIRDQWRWCIYSVRKPPR